MERDFNGYLTDQRAAPQSLTARRLETIRYLSHGLSPEQVADAMYIEHDTVLQHMKAARLELGAKTTAHAVAIALRLGLID